MHVYIITHVISLSHSIFLSCFYLYGRHRRRSIFNKVCYPLLSCTFCSVRFFFILFTTRECVDSTVGNIFIVCSLLIILYTFLLLKNISVKYIS